MPQTVPDGIIYPDLDTVGDDLPAIFATMASSVQEAISDLRADFDQANTPATVSQATFGTPSNGTTVQFFGLRRVGKLLSGSMRLTRASAIVHGQVLFTVATAYQPAVGTLLPLTAIQSGGSGNLAQGGGAAVEADGDIITFSPGTRDTLEVVINWIIP